MRFAVVLALLCIAAPAAAQPADINGVDPCARAENMAKKDAEPGTALIYLILCQASGTDVAMQISKLEARLRADGYVAVTVETDPTVAGSVGFIDALGDVPFPLPATVLVPPGTRRIAAIAPGHHGAGQQVMLSKGGKATTIALRLDKARTTGSSTDVDFSDDVEAAAPTTSEDLPAAEHDDLLKAKFRRGLDADGGTVAQSKKRHAFGGSVGLSAGTLSGGDAEGSRVGLAAALVLAYRVSGPLVFLPELGFAQRGADATTLDYLTIPVRVGYARQLGPVAVHGAAGPELAITVSSGSMTESEAMDLGVSAGLGVHVPAGSGAVLIDAYLRVGLTDVMSSVAGKDRSLSVRAGYLF